MFCISVSNWKQMKADFTLLLHLSLLGKYALMMLSSLQHDYCTVNNVCNNFLPQCWIIAFCNCHYNGPAGYYNQPTNVTKITAFTAEIVMKGRVNRFKAAGNKPPLHRIPASAHQWVVALCYCNTQLASWSLCYHLSASERTAVKQNRESVWYWDHDPTGSWESTLLLLLDGVEKSNCVANTSTTDSGICGMNLIYQNVILKW